MSRQLGLLALVSCAAGCGLLAAWEPAQIEACVERAPGLPSQRALSGAVRAGFEIVDPLGGGVWLTRDWTVDAYEDFTFPWSWLHWQKNDPRRGVADAGRFLRSPGCPADGQFTYMTAFGREFVQVVDLRAMPTRLEGGRIRRIELEKHHVLSYAASSTVRVLASPEGERFILVAETFERTQEPSVPQGWTLDAFELRQPVEVDLTGDVSVLRMTNEDSFQGPLSPAEWAQIRAWE